MTPDQIVCQQQAPPASLAAATASNDLTALDWLTQALNKVEGQQAWRVRHLLSLALCQGSEDGKPEVPKTLAKALELATAANLQPLRVSQAVGVCSSARPCMPDGRATGWTLRPLQDNFNIAVS